MAEQLRDEPTLAGPQERVVPAADDQRFRLLVDSIQEYAIFMLDVQGRIVSWNAGAQRIKQYEAREIIGRSFEAFYPAAAVAAGWPQHELKLAAEQGRYEEEGWRIRKDGSRFWANVVITALRGPGGVLTGFAKVTRDLTERRQQEERLERSEEQFRLLLESVKDYAIFMLDEQGAVLTWNSGAQAIKGYAAHEVVGRSFSMFFTPQDVEAGLPERELADALRDGRAESEGWRVRKDGTLFWADVVITPVRDADGKLRGYAKVTRDLTERRRLATLEESHQRTHEFIAMLAHELRNPLAAIRNAVTILQLKSPPPEQAQRVGETIDRQLRQLTRLIDDLLDAGRIVAGKIVLKREPLDLHDVVQFSVESAMPSIEQRHHRLTINLPPQPVWLLGDSARLAQALLNLLHNAARYTPEGGAIALDVVVDGGAVELRVSDNGIGIEPAALERIFDRFTQEYRTKPPDSGLGVGLALARVLVEQHGGKLTAASDGPGRGSTFTMSLPVLPPQVGDPALSAPPQPERAPPQGLRILVVDDNRDAADSMVQLLELLGHEARLAYSAAEAVEVARSFAPRAVLLDLNLPDGDGFTVLKTLRAHAAAPMFVAALTGYGQTEDRKRTLAAGFQLHLTKPLELRDLELALKTAQTYLANA